MSAIRVSLSFSLEDGEEEHKWREEDRQVGAKGETASSGSKEDRKASTANEVERDRCFGCVDWKYEAIRKIFDSGRLFDSLVSAESRERNHLHAKHKVSAKIDLHSLRYVSMPFRPRPFSDLAHRQITMSYYTTLLHGSALHILITTKGPMVPDARTAVPVRVASNTPELF